MRNRFFPRATTQLSEQSVLKKRISFVVVMSVVETGKLRAPNIFAPKRHLIGFDPKKVAPFIADL
jgi:hypothetical protein